MPQDDETSAGFVAHEFDGKQMVRFYFEDEEGNKWLLSKNEGVEPICINDMKDAIIARILR